LTDTLPQLGLCLRKSCRIFTTR